MNDPLASDGRDCTEDLRLWERPILDWQLRAPASARPLVARSRKLSNVLLVDGRLGQGCIGARSPAPYGFVVVDFIIDGRGVGCGELQSLSLERGDVAVWNTRQKLNFEVLTAMHKFMLVVPIRQARKLWPDLISPNLLHFSHRDALSPILAACFESFLAGVDSMADAYASAAAEAGLDVAVRACRVQRDEGPSDRKSLLMQRIIGYLEANLRDPELNHDRVATEFNVSTRYLQILFARSGATVSEWIRQRRLENCRKALETKSRTETITNIALAWGFNDASHFSRLFRQRFGITPQNYALSCCESALARGVSAAHSPRLGPDPWIRARTPG
ncbi:helix-turn-helix domain-containing protein [Bradyrhizobium sp. GCM10027634]|uniref:helix-turn-helix domain-containing protein n=1 Tax=unclassified Bradyrhizobium TaxID=2631580 RepID=UPI00188CC28F|nr:MULTISPECIES: helix-turn-helix domain-containing protein [unclassified Bradyrhizobium]MDN5005601.1 helix-turn-helix domain-containing protein [Bradyrhizobium sp. WYCCWR 12677]